MNTTVHQFSMSEFLAQSLVAIPSPRFRSTATAIIQILMAVLSMDFHFSHRLSFRTSSFLTSSRIHCSTAQTTVRYKGSLCVCSPQSRTVLHHDFLL
jgi:hypothetical protein